MWAENQEYGNGTDTDLTGTVLHITTRFTNEYEYDVTVAKVNDSSGQPTYEFQGGYAVDVFLYLQSMLNFTYKLHPELPNGFEPDSIKNASLDLYVSSFSLLPIRTQYLDPSFAIGQSKILAFMDRAFEADTLDQNIFIIPFTTNLWICAAIVWTIFLIGFLILNYYEMDSSMDDIVFHCITITLQRGTFLSLFHNSTRIATVVLSVTIVVIMASYSGIMTSIAAVNRYTINSIESLIQSNYRIYMEFGINSNRSSIKFMLEALMHIPSVVRLIRKVEASNFVFLSFDDAIRQVTTMPVAYIIDEETGIFSVTETLGGMPCSWAKIPVFNLRYPWVMYLRKNATFRERFNAGIVRIRERGILKRIRKKWITPFEFCNAGNDFPFKSINFPQVYGAFKLLIIGMLIACPGLFLLEKIKKILARSANRVVALQNK